MWSARWSETDQVRIGVARDVTELKRAEFLQAAVYEISEAAHTTEDLPALFRRIHEIVQGLLPAGNFHVALHDPLTERLSFPYFVDEHDRSPETCSINAGTLTAEVIRSGRALLWAHDTTGSPDPPPLLRGAGTGAQASLGVPLRTGAGVIGALVVQSYTDEVRYTESDEELLQFVSDQVASAIARKQNEARLQRLALYDPLTDLPNRTLLDDRVETALSRARRESSHFAVLYVDVDGFKAANDRFGHSLGDRLLVEIAKRLVRCLRAADTVGRLGGDEFVVLLSQIVLPDDAEAVARKIQDSLSQPYAIDDRRLQLTASIGIAVYPDDGETSEALLDRADGAMYRAKRNGGDRFELAATADRTAA
jgi:diguanylate cyclase (GGDEF)-like protein